MPKRLGPNGQMKPKASGAIVALGSERTSEGKRLHLQQSAVPVHRNYVQHHHYVPGFYHRYPVVRSLPVYGYGYGYGHPYIHDYGRHRRRQRRRRSSSPSSRSSRSRSVFHRSHRSRHAGTDIGASKRKENVLMKCAGCGCGLSREQTEDDSYVW